MSTLDTNLDVKAKTIATIPYSDFSASTTYYPYYKNVLNPNAKVRTWTIANSMNEAITSSQVSMIDSEIGGSGSSPAYAWENGMTLGDSGAGGANTQTSEDASGSASGMLASHVDSCQFSLGMGATAPTSGNLIVRVAEGF